MRPHFRASDVEKMVYENNRRKPFDYLKNHLNGALSILGLCNNVTI